LQLHRLPQMSQDAIEYIVDARADTRGHGDHGDPRQHGGDADSYGRRVVAMQIQMPDQRLHDHVTVLGLDAVHDRFEASNGERRPRRSPQIVQIEMAQDRLQDAFHIAERRLADQLAETHVGQRSRLFFVRLLLLDDRAADQRQIRRLSGSVRGVGLVSAVGADVVHIVEQGRDDLLQVLTFPNVRLQFVADRFSNDATET
jgi:hypothetical protein